VYLNVTASERLYDLRVSFTSRSPRILRSAAAQDANRQVWQASYTAAAGDEVDGNRVTFTVTARDSAGNTVTRSVTTDSSAVLFSTSACCFVPFLMVYTQASSVDLLAEL